MLQHLLPASGSFFKANLHTHSTCSDGVWTINEIKKEFKSKGYQIVAFTDHEICLDHSDLNDDEFLAITSYEASINQEVPKGVCWEYAKVYHFNLYAKNPHNTTQVCFSYDDLWGGALKYKNEVKYLGELHHKKYNTEDVNYFISEANNNGFLVCYNHPVWSLQTACDYDFLEGLWAVEIVNGATCIEGYEEHQPHVFEEMLRQGKRVLPLATDDCHAKEQAFVGFTMIKSPDLSYDNIMTSLENGDFYCSDGPEIYSIDMEDGFVSISCSEAVQIRIQTERRLVYVQNADEGSFVKNARFNLSNWYSFRRKDDDKNCFFRISVRSADGRCAYSRAYFIDEVRKQFV